MIKRKYIDGTHWNWVDEYTYVIQRISGEFIGYLSYIDIIKVKYKLQVDYEDSSVCLFDDGYKCLVYLPDNENWCLSTIYNSKDELVEWYFDMTAMNSTDDDGKPYYDDLFLDIAVSPDFLVRILDEDELKDAFDRGTISEKQYFLAYDTCEKVIRDIIPRRDFMVYFFQEQLERMKMQ